MSARRSGLGRGLGALIPVAPPPPDERDGPGSSAGDFADYGDYADHGSGRRTRPAVVDDGPLPVHGATFREIPVDAIVPNARQPRTNFDEDALEELAASLREVGLLQPIVVRSLGTDRYELVMGERRWRACQLAELDRVPAIVRETADEAMLRDALLENLHRQQLNPLEEAAAYEQLLRDFGATHEELAGRLGRSRSHVTNTIRLLGLSPAVQRRVAAGVLSAGHARALLSLRDPQAQDRLATRIVAEGLSVRAVEEIVALDEEVPRTRAPRGPRAASPVLARFADQLSDQFETRVKVDMGRNKGRITVEFASIEDLERIVAVMSPATAHGGAGAVDGLGVVAAGSDEVA
ncbi:putative chromosome-partitioning protein ParB [Frankia canadensis]|uniref:Putative chromosome-partitioning protein ParB n=1 Tax=Frankia canadensis TaxID=1836972 RepID=A0A2I2L0I2_9ACTN|nr:ParB/RepB/Spo0J family partition protein [Frankia canadensis]SNQ51431.1 putative chromosome-partitioning protein ParB [Frankia canadensis]SOU58721.1 putative chromosome-partitioning protein ParB [Frankia canadensis]